MKAWSFIWRWAVCVVPSIALSGYITIAVAGPEAFMAGAVISMLVMVPAAIQAADAVQLDETAKKSIAAVNKLLDDYLAEKK